jgi:hypothetical protein
MLGLLSVRPSVHQTPDRSWSWPRRLLGRPPQPTTGLYRPQRTQRDLGELERRRRRGRVRWSEPGHPQGITGGRFDRVPLRSWRGRGVNHPGRREASLSKSLLLLAVPLLDVRGPAVELLRGRGVARPDRVAVPLMRGPGAAVDPDRHVFHGAALRAGVVADRDLPRSGRGRRRSCGRGRDRAACRRCAAAHYLRRLPAGDRARAHCACSDQRGEQRSRQDLLPHSNQLPHTNPLTHLALPGVDPHLQQIMRSGQ